jgi:hypothetical protein
MFVLTACAVAACGGEDDDGDTAADGGVSLTATARAANAPEFEGGTVRSGALGYSAELPQEWSIQPTVDLPNGQQDTFIAPPSPPALPTTITVRCLRADNEVAAVQAALTETSRAFADVTPGAARSVDGQEAASARYTAGQPPLNVEREDVVFANGRCVWTISYVNAPGARDGYLNDFERFLSTFTATP